MYPHRMNMNMVMLKEPFVDLILITRYRSSSSLM